MISEEILGYAAGVLDGDGYFKIEKRKVKGMLNPIIESPSEPHRLPHPLLSTFWHVHSVGTLRLQKGSRDAQRPLSSWRICDRMAVPTIDPCSLVSSARRRKPVCFSACENLRLEASWASLNWSIPTDGGGK